MDLLKKRLEDAEQAASAAEAEVQQLRAKLVESKLNETGRHSHRVDSLQMDSSIIGVEHRHREELEGLRNQLVKISADAQIDAQKFDR